MTRRDVPNHQLVGAGVLRANLRLVPTAAAPTLACLVRDELAHLVRDGNHPAATVLPLVFISLVPHR